VVEQKILLGIGRLKVTKTGKNPKKENEVKKGPETRYSMAHLAVKKDADPNTSLL